MLDLDKDADKEITRMYSVIYFRRNFIRCLTDIFKKHAESEASINVFKIAWLDIKAGRLLTGLKNKEAKDLLSNELKWIEENWNKILIECKMRAKQFGD